MRAGKWVITILLAGVMLGVSVHSIFAYRITDFNSEIKINRNTRLEVTETIQTFFDVSKHGIYRNIPVIYRSPSKNINIRLRVVSVKDEAGNDYQYSLSKSGNDTVIKIGDANATITGAHTYVISYTADNVLQRFPDHEELYWNTVGTGWDTTIEKATATVTAPDAQVINSKCFGECKIGRNSNGWQVVSQKPIMPGDDLTFVLGYAQPNNWVFPNPTAVFWRDDGIFIILELLPAIILGILWWKRGRDFKFVSPNVYYQDPGSVQTTASPFGREHLPMVYSPIAGLTPSEAGTILDMRVDLSDVVAEISELARLGYIKIFKLEQKRLILGEKDDYIFFRTTKEPGTELKDHQKYLLDNLFAASYKPTLSELEKFVTQKDIIASKNKSALVSKMSGKFYTDLNAFKEKLYKNLTDEGYFTGRPDQVKAGGIVLAAILGGAATYGANIFSLSQKIWPIGVVAGIIAVLFGSLMARRTAKGHAFYRQITGLKYYVGKGKWRYDIEEKNLFIEEILPLAISLGVVGKLTADMKTLNMQPPQYMGNMAYGDFGFFSHAVGHSMAMTPTKSSGGWSGGSGFSGGGGGGFGGGGGGSW